MSGTEARGQRTEVRRRAFALMIAIVMIALVATASVALMILLRAEASRTAPALDDAQLRQLLIAGGMARSYVEKHGAAIMLSGLDREAEYRSDEGAQVYLARSGMNPLAYYSLLQKMTAMGSASGGLAQLYRTHPPLDERLDHIDRRAGGPLQAYTQR